MIAACIEAIRHSFTLPFDEALAILRPVLEDPSILKVAQNLKYDYLLMKRYGVVIKGFDDTMLMSYVLDAGKGNHGMDGLSEKWLDHTPIAYKEVAGSGKSLVTFDQVDIDKATAYAALWLFITLLIGAFFASLSATWGGRRRDL
mgnify:CR=1 FL=1